eukprot:CAMPEP_0118944350 /NCGR_PEP_ID=MMETSP1169-20130426/40122_1 /TAXON_ID=36882 /ORGANISM="Pyramimonas obovata, Strain CCMP722" /LENGTH=193 /DNA_ID=CAMNT_0006889813 /DNA_START=166 /DNA_END=744 /DNA_ORIENTATION=-
MWTRFTAWGRAYARVTAAAPVVAAAAATCVASTSLAGQALSEPPPDAEPRERAAASGPLRVLVTGFHDWRELEGNCWRCRDNPSCRLIYGPPCDFPPIQRTGPLVKAVERRRPLSNAGPDVEVTYQTLPTLWNTAAGLDLTHYNLVIHMGLGVYDNKHTLLLECGATNARRGTDAAGGAPPGGQGGPLDPSGA